MVTSMEDVATAHEPEDKFASCGDGLRDFER